MKRLATFLLTCLVASPVHARIGETVQQIEARYGKPFQGAEPIKAAERTEFYRWNGFEILVGYSGGKSAFESFAKLANDGRRGDLTPVDIQQLFLTCTSSHLSGGEWIVDDADTAYRVWVKTDGAIGAKYSKAEQLLQFSDAKFLVKDVQESTKQSATVEITGAFGITLGEKVDLSEYKQTDETADKIPIYEFVPKNPIQGLAKYHFFATPKGGVIYGILASGDFENQPLCKRQQEVILELLKKKYGREDKPEDVVEGFEQGFSGKTTITRGHQVIVLTRRGLLGLTLDLFYVDGSLQKRAKKERIEQDGKNTDGSGL